MINQIFKIGYSYTEAGSILVPAKNREEAEKILEKEIEKNSLNNLDNILQGHKVTDREYTIWGR